ncbi:hypothetical protein F528_1189 [Neisseria meningitidis 992008]|nr:hypothetical protein F528_1189 [Neisseria meningitidis 992008]
MCGKENGIQIGKIKMPSETGFQTAFLCKLSTISAKTYCRKVENSG